MVVAGVVAEGVVGGAEAGGVEVGGVRSPADVDESVETTADESGGAELTDSVEKVVSGIAPADELGGAVVISDTVAGRDDKGRATADEVSAVTTDLAVVGVEFGVAGADEQPAVTAMTSTQPAVSRRRPLMRYHGKPPRGTMDP